MCNLKPREKTSKMNNQLARLIADYQTSVLDAVVLMQRSGIRMPYSSNDWIFTDIPSRGELYGGGKYFKHGTGCQVSLTTGEVDFDFGTQGEIGGFDVWRLIRFAGSNLADYDFASKEVLEQCFEAALTAGSLVCSEYNLYFVADASRTRAVNIDSRFPHDKLPCRNQDSVLMLYAHCFLAADLMRVNYVKLNSKRDNIRQLSRKNRVHFGIYISTWLGFLREACNGFKTLNMRLLLQNDRPENFKELIPISDNIGRLMNKHSDSLRVFRNNVFHPRENSEVILEFFAKDAERLLWAHELHAALELFFSEYRILCEVYYMLNNRKTESDLIRKPKRQK